MVFLPYARAYKKIVKKHDKHVLRIGVFENKNLPAANTRFLAVLAQWSDSQPNAWFKSKFPT